MCDAVNALYYGDESRWPNKDGDTNVLLGSQMCADIDARQLANWNAVRFYPEWFPGVEQPDLPTYLVGSHTEPYGTSAITEEAGTVPYVNPAGMQNPDAAYAINYLLDHHPIAASFQGTPIISGDAEIGATLVVGYDGSPTGTPAPTLTYQWRRDGVNIDGATASTYITTEDDGGAAIDCDLTASNRLGAASINSNAITMPSLAPVFDHAPVISGNTAYGSELTLDDDGSPSNSPTSVTYQWQRADTSGGTYSDIGGATSSTYDATPSDVGKYLRCVVTATNMHGSTTDDSNAVGPMQDYPYNFVGAYSAGSYSLGDVVTFHGSAYVATSAGSSPGVPPDNSGFWTEIASGYDFLDVWSSSTTYYPGDIVTDGGSPYRCTVKSTNEQPSTHSGSWSAASLDNIAASPSTGHGWTNQGAWTSGHSYSPGDITTYIHSTFLCTSAIAGNNPPPDDAAHWTPIAEGTYYTGSSWTSGIDYARTQIVFYVGTGHGTHRYWYATSEAVADSSNRPAGVSSVWLPYSDLA